ncbi:CD209 antigen-like protein A [Protopterus annectens]|uniref:CD209 antigen-like protein A n=1 Tax=Protopterus annectens TaxID=7888 RepID=UPI001CF9D8AA|nr:CD209 antigen-like protein A [Protopterus annectens]
MDKVFCFLLLVVLWSTDLIQCMNELSTCPQNISSGSADDLCEPCWKRFGGKCYQVSQDAKIWNFSRESCNKLGANLITMKSQEEQNFMKTQNISWIGLHYLDSTWQWVDGSNVGLR